MAAAQIHYMKQFDTSPPFRIQVLQRDGVTPQNLSGCSAVFNMSKGKEPGGAVIVNRGVCVITDPTNGWVEYQWNSSSDTAVATADGDDNRAEVEITLPTGKVETCPNKTDCYVRIRAQIA